MSEAEGDPAAAITSLPDEPGQVHVFAFPCVHGEAFEFISEKVDSQFHQAGVLVIAAPMDTDLAVTTLDPHEVEEWFFRSRRRVDDE